MVNLCQDQIIIDLLKTAGLLKVPYDLSAYYRFLIELIMNYFS